MKNLTIRKKFIPKLLLTLLPLVIFINLYNLKITYLLRDNAASSGSELSSIYMREMDTTLTDLHTWLVNTSNDTAHMSAFSSDDLSKRIEEQNYFTALIKNAENLYPALDTAFIISTKYSSSTIISNKNISIDEYQEFSQLATMISKYHQTNSYDWTALRIPNETSCCLCSFIALDDTVLGIVVKPQTLLSSMPFALDHTKNFVLAKHDGYVLMTTLPKQYGSGIDLTGDLSKYYVTGDKKNIIVCGAQSTVGPFRLMMLTSESEIEQDIAWAKWISFILLFVSIITLIAIIVRFRVDVIQPLEKIDDAIEKVGKSNFSQQLIPNKEAREFITIYDTFNHMTNQIKKLKIENYEQLLHKQQAELHFYQAQIKPHFILNCLTTIQNLSRQSKTEELNYFISDFSSFSRYLFRTDFTLVSLRDELAQVKHYISMQELRYPDLIFYAEDIENTLSDFKIPAMLIQTLVENSIKHGMDEDSGISIFIHCQKVFMPDSNYVHIIIEDSGSSLPQTILSVINDFHSDHTVLGFGLKNILTVLELTYGNSYSIHADNLLSGGVRIRISICAKLEEQF